MGIDKIAIKGHVILKDQTWPQNGKLNQGLNIITSKNGGGKTKILEYIANKYRVNHNITHISASVQHFKCIEDIAQYGKPKKAIRPPEARQFVHLYPVITHLPSNKELIQDCNSFFVRLKLDISLDENFVQGYRLLFNHPRCKDNKRLPLSELSTGEKTAFILWLMMHENPKPDILLLDEFDSSINDDILQIFYRQLQELSKECQIFATTNRWRYSNDFLDNKHNHLWHTIENGEIINKYPTQKY